MNALFTILKIITAIFWLIFIYNFIEPFEGQWNVFILWGGVLLAVAHLAEFFIFRNLFKLYCLGFCIGCRYLRIRTSDHRC